VFGGKAWWFVGDGFIYEKLDEMVIIITE